MRQFLFLGSIHLAVLFTAILRFHQQELIKQSSQSRHSPTTNSSHTAKSMRQVLDRAGLGLCLLIKDDNDILPEFLAYHYHALQMRTLVVAIDPSSQESPTSILQRFQLHLPDLNILVWSDQTYMPTDFLNGDYSSVPDFIGRHKNNATHSFWHSSATSANSSSVFYEQQIQQQLLDVNNHRFRQVKFAGKCIRHLYFHSNQRWMTHIDTDEFLVMHPNILKKQAKQTIQQMQYQQIALELPRRIQDSAIATTKTSNQSSNENISSINTLRRPWETLQPGSLLQLLEAWLRKFPLKNTRSCVQVRRLFYGDREDESSHDATTNENDNDESSRQILQTFQSKRFETLRWKWHAKTNAQVNGYPKVLLDLPQIRHNDSLLQPGNPVMSVHRLSADLCEAGNPHSLWNHRPLVANHYLGSLQHYLAKQDFRRNSDNHKTKALAAKVSNTESIQWLRQWLPQMTRHVGLVKMKALLPEYVV